MPKPQQEPNSMPGSSDGNADTVATEASPTGNQRRIAFEVNLGTDRQTLVWTAWVWDNGHTQERNHPTLADAITLTPGAPKLVEAAPHVDDAVLRAWLSAGQNRLVAFKAQWSREQQEYVWATWIFDNGRFRDFYQATLTDALSQAQTVMANWAREAMKL